MQSFPLPITSAEETSTPTVWSSINALHAVAFCRVGSKPIVYSDLRSSGYIHLTTHKDIVAIEHLFFDFNVLSIRLKVVD